MRLQADARRTPRHGPLPPWMPAGLPSVAGLSSLSGFSVPAPQRAGTACSVHWAASADDVRDAQRLRYRVFVHEMGARLAPPVGTPAGLDADRFDPFCDHLLVRAPADVLGRRGAVVGTYRVLRPEAARRAGGLYAETEFDLAPLAALRAQAVELGRSCVHPAWRSGSVIMALWSALAQYMQQHRLNTMIGCASMSVADGGDAARQLWLRLRETHLVLPRWQVQPYAPLPPAPDTLQPSQSPHRQKPSAQSARSTSSAASAAIAGMPQLQQQLEQQQRQQQPRPAPLPCAPARSLPASTPPLIKGYLRCGARLLGPPALDAAFNTADLPMMLHLDDLAPRYRRHLLGR